MVDCIKIELPSWVNVWVRDNKYIRIYFEFAVADMFMFRSFFSVSDFVRDVMKSMGFDGNDYRVFVDFYRYPKPRVRIVVQFPRVVG